MKYLILILLAFLQVALAVTLGYKKHSKVSRAVILFAINMAFWTCANAALDYFQYQVKASPETLDIINRIGFFAGTLSLLFAYRLSLVFPVDRGSTRKTRLITIIGVVVPFFTLFPSVAGGFSAGEDQVAQYTYGPLVFVVGIYAVFLAIASARNLFEAFKSVDSLIKKQAITLFTGLTLCIFTGIFFITVIPAVTGDEKYLFLGYYAPFIFTASIFYSILRQQFLDFRLLVVRSIAYVLTLATFAAIYTFLVFGIFSRFLGTGQLTVPQQFLYVIAALFLALSFQPFKKFFDKQTNKLFYRDAYDTQDLLNDFNQAIVSTIDIRQLLDRSGQTIEEYIKPEYIAFAIRDSEADVLRLIRNDESKFAKEAIEQIRTYIHKSTEKVFITDNLSEENADLRQLLQKSNIGSIARITPDVSVEGIGYVIFGYKKSGNVYNPQDIAAIEITANELAIAIQNALQFEEIQKFNVTLQEKVEQATRKLQKTNEKLKTLDETKDEFISMASHQLRTPLTSVKGYLSMVIEGDAGDLNEMQHKLLDQAFTSSQRMVYLIADLLNVSRLRTGKFIIEAAPTNLADVIQGEVEQLVETASSRGLTLKYDKPENFPTLMLDETKVRQVIMNFIDNAIYYTPTGGNITIKLKDLGQSVEYTVVDDGIGVPKAEQHHLFSKFYRAGNAKKARPDGTGLGLFMARKVIVAQGGSIVFKSTEGKGSTFGFTFAKDKLAAAANGDKETAE